MEEISLDLNSIEECKQQLDSIANRIDTLLNFQLCFEESKGKTADALLEQYKMLEETLREMKDLSVNMGEAIVSTGEAFKATDRKSAKLFSDGKK